MLPGDMLPGGATGSAADETGASDPVALPPESALVHRELPALVTSTLVNPERGFYAGIDLVGDPGEAHVLRAEGHSLALALVVLSSHRTTALPDTLLDALERGLAEVRAAGLKLIVRFTYNDDGGDDASKAQILAHLAQLRPVLAGGADVIATVQAGFIGAWGEWHGSSHGLDNAADRSEILHALLQAVPVSRTVQVRTPMFKEEALPGGALQAGEAFSGTLRARVGHHNDCFLASSSDMGTYASPIDAWKRHVADDGLYTPVGGETCRLQAPRTDCASALAELRAQHWSYLNRAYNTDVLDGWQAQGCFDEVAAGLGYRLLATAMDHTAEVVAGETLYARISVRNQGFAAPYNPRPVVAVLRGAGLRLELPIAADPRQFTPGGETQLQLRWELPASLPPGSYQLALWLPDATAALQRDPRYAIQLANAGVWSAEHGDNVLATVQVRTP
jgi:hypothetical protein